MNASVKLMLLAAALAAGCSRAPDNITAIPGAGRPAHIQPDYAGVTIPPNIAPMNFSVKEPGTGYLVVIRGASGDPVRIETSSGDVRIPPGPWKELLAANTGRDLTIEICVKDSADRWIRFDAISDHIAQEPIDGYLVYRKFGPLFNQWGKMGIYQRCLENFDETPVIINSMTGNNCMNCHNFYKNGTDKWILHMRGGSGTAMLLVDHGKVTKIDTRTKFNASPAGYPAWHPSGNLMAFSAGRPLQFFHSIGETRDELDRTLDIVVYDIRTNTVTTVPEISSPDSVEVWPVWSPDGRYLYFCSAPKMDNYLVTAPSGEDSLAFGTIKFSLKRIAYDPDTHAWGKLETVLSSAATGQSISEPRFSPDGRFLVYTASAYGSFPVFHRDADLYLLDIARGTTKRLELNSDRPEGFHSWSSNGRWMVFSSKRVDGQFTMPFIGHIDSLGVASKPFALPQEDPEFYETQLQIYNVPELIREPVGVSPRTLTQAAYSGLDTLSAKLDPNVRTMKK